MFTGTLPTNAAAVAKNAMHAHDAIEQRVRLACSSARLRVRGSAEAIAAETRGPAQQTFPMVRTAHGPSSNLRNNAIYDRKSDWMLEFPHGTVISPRSYGEAVTFEVALAADAEIVFRPLYYQRHKNLPYFTPWSYSIRKDSITGWSSWWAYTLTFHVPAGYALVRAEIGDAPAACATHGAIVRVSCTPTHTRSVAWQVEFTKKT